MKVKKRKSREERLGEIKHAAKQLFIEKGFHKTTMEDIIARTELSKGGFYHYYGSTKEILMDIMENSNLFYVQNNPHMQRLSSERSSHENVEILTEAVIEKMLGTSDDRKLYAIFASEMLFDEDVLIKFRELEAKFHIWLCKRLSIDREKHHDDLYFVSRIINGISVTEQLFNQPEILERERQSIRTFLTPYIERILEIA